jgi:hypothetical protein
MKIKYTVLAVTVITAIGILFLVGCEKHSTINADVEQSIGGTKLKLVGRYEPLHLYIYADTASTNKFPDYAIFEGHEAVFRRQNEPSNIVAVTHFENAVGVLTTERDSNERILKRIVRAYGDNLRDPTIHGLYLPIYEYVDMDGDGLWDRFLIYGERKTLVRSNLCWVPIIKKSSADIPPAIFGLLLETFSSRAAVPQC